jgi:hypothetical protein
MTSRKLNRPRIIAPVLHLIVFCVMILASSKPDGLDFRGSVAFFSFFGLFLLDFSISILGLSMMWGAADAEASTRPALILWAVLGTLWWFLLGMSIEAWIRRFRKPEASE